MVLIHLYSILAKIFQISTIFIDNLGTKEGFEHEENSVNRDSVELDDEDFEK